MPRIVVSRMDTQRIDTSYHISDDELRRLKLMTHAAARAWLDEAVDFSTSRGRYIAGREVIDAGEAREWRVSGSRDDVVDLDSEESSPPSGGLTRDCRCDDCRRTVGVQS